MLLLPSGSRAGLVAETMELMKWMISSFVVYDVPADVKAEWTSGTFGSHAKLCT